MKLILFNMIENRVSKIVFIAALVILGMSNSVYPNAPEKSISFSNIEFQMPDIPLPQIPVYEVSIADYGAVSGGQHLNTGAFAAAIESVSKKGGGKVIVPAGIWLTGPIVLQSNLELHAEQGALVVFSKDKELYPLVKTSFEGVDTWRCMSPLYGVDLENVAFTGKGVWDGSGEAWRFVKKSKLTASQWKKLVASGGVVSDDGDEWYPSEQFKKAQLNADMNVPSNLNTKAEYEAIRDFLRPVMVSIQSSKNVLFDGPVFQNSPAWCIHPLMVENLVVRNLTVRNPWYSQNGDGIDIESCKNVLVENCSFDVGDDAICIKSGKDEDGRRRGIPSQNLVIRDNIVYHGHGGVTVGSEMSGGVKNMHVSNCTFIGTDVGLRFKSNRGRGGVVEDVFISKIRMTDIPTFAISFNLYYGGMAVTEMLEEGTVNNERQKVPVTEETPQFRDIFISDITVDGALQAVLLQGLPEMKLENVKLKNMILKAEKGFTIADASGIRIENVKLLTENNRAFDIYNSNNLEINHLDFDFATEDAIIINGTENNDIYFKSMGSKHLKQFIRTGNEVPASAVNY